MTSPVLISIIVPIYNGSSWIAQCFEAILQQRLTPNLEIEVCACNDASTDETATLLQQWVDVFQTHAIPLKIFVNGGETPGGVGFAKNRAVSISSGEYLCFQDIDDVMLPDRISEQCRSAQSLPPNTLIGSQFKRMPENSTVRYTEWANSLPAEKLHIQIYTSHGPTVIMPTWLCHRSVFDKVGGFCENARGTPEDLIFFYKHLDLGGKVFRIDQPLLIYTYSLQATTFSIEASTIWNLRLERLERDVLPRWRSFTIWNAGKQGRRLYTSLSRESKRKVVALCDVDAKKIGKPYVAYDSVRRCSEKPINIVHFRDAAAPFVICVKLNLTNGEFEENLRSLRLEENVDYILFS